MSGFKEGLKIGQTAITNMVIIATQKVGAFLPGFLGALLILLAGWIIAVVLRGFSRRIFRIIGISYIAERSGVNDLLQKLGAQRKAEDLLASLVYLVVFLIFVVAATEVLGIRIVIETLNSFIAYLPQVFGAIFVFVFLAYLGRLLHQVVLSFFESYQLTYGKIIGKVLEVLVVIFALLMALRKLGFETTIFTANLTLIMSIFLAAVGLALSLGMRDIARKIVAGFYLRKHLHIGDEIQIGNLKSKVISFENTAVKGETPEGLILIPNDQILENIVQIKKSS